MYPSRGSYPNGYLRPLLRFGALGKQLAPRPLQELSAQGSIWLGGQWNAAGTALGVNAPNGFTGNLIDLQINGVSKGKVDKDGNFIFGSTGGIKSSVYSTFTIGDGGYSWNSNTQIILPSLTIAADTTGQLRFQTSNRAVTYATLFSPSANLLHLHNDANAVTFGVFRTRTDGSNYQRLALGWSSTTALIHNEGTGTGADGSVAFNDAALATDATKGFVMIPSCPGTATGTPADIPTGQTPFVYDSTNSKFGAYSGGAWRWTPTNTLSRGSAQVTLSNVTNGATATGNITLPKSSIILSIQTSRAAWARIYSSATASSNDSARTRTTAPSAGAGVIADVITTGAQTIEMEPAPTAANRESPVTTTFPVRATNDGSTGDVVITVSYLTLEN